MILFTVFGFTALYIYRALHKACSRATHAICEQKRAAYYKELVSRHNVEEVTLATSDGIAISGLLLVRPKAKRVLLMCHGYRQSKEFLAPLADIFTDDTLLMIDFRAHGASGGTVISWGYDEALDVEAAAAFLAQDIRTKNLILYGMGFSMGTAALVKAAQATPFKGLILDSGFAVLEEQARRFFTQATGLPQIAHCVSQYFYMFCMRRTVTMVNTCQILKKLTIPVLIIHSEEDKTVPVQDAFELYSCIRSKKELWIVQGSSHVGIYKTYPEEYKAKVSSFLHSIEANKH